MSATPRTKYVLRPVPLTGPPYVPIADDYVDIERPSTATEPIQEPDYVAVERPTTAPEYVEVTTSISGPGEQADEVQDENAMEEEEMKKKKRPSMTRKLARKMKKRVQKVAEVVKTTKVVEGDKEESVELEEFVLPGLKMKLRN